VADAVHARNWHAALSLALTLPDICARLERPEVKSSRLRYTDWCDRYISPRYTMQIGGSAEPHVFLSGSDCYALRCAVLHEGSDDIVNQRAKYALDGFRFTEPLPGVFIHMNKLNNRLQLEVDRFCADVCAAVAQWLDDVASRDDVQTSMGSLMRVEGPAADGSFAI
jgi:hypothetical protein